MGPKPDFKISGLGFILYKMEAYGGIMYQYNIFPGLYSMMYFVIIVSKYL